MILEPHDEFEPQDIESLLAKSTKLELSASAKKAVKAAQSFVQDLAGSSKPIYGVNTGFGRLASVKISESELVELQINLLRSHSSGFGGPAKARIVRRLLLLRVLSLAKGHSGISLQIINRHLDYLYREAYPFIPMQGSVGASGDLAPLSHLGLTFIGEGYFLEKNKKVRAQSFLKKHKLQPIDIGPKEGLSLTNGTQFSLSLALEARAQLYHLIPWMETAAALSVEGHQATSQVFLPKVHKLKAHADQLAIAKKMYSELKSSKHMSSHRDCDRVQDSYSFRCIPQIMGPCYSIIRSADQFLRDEINSVSDNPVVFPAEKKIYSCGHFHAQAVSMACDMISLSVATLSNLIERRIDQLVNPLTARNPAFLASRPGVESGLMIVQTAAAAITSENKTMSFPASADSIPTNGNQEDHVSMAPWAARKALRMVTNLRRLVASEILCAVRACVNESTRTGLAFSPFVEKELERLATQVPELFQAGDRVFADDLEKLEAIMTESE